MFKESKDKILISFLLLLASTKLIQMKSHMRGFTFGFAQAAPKFSYGITMWYGGYLVENEGVKYEDAFK